MTLAAVRSGWLKPEKRSPCFPDSVAGVRSIWRYLSAGIVPLSAGFAAILRDRHTYKKFRMQWDLLSKFKNLKLTELDLAPTGAGVYAWYSTPQIGSPDWRRSLDPMGRDTGEAAFRRLLAKHSSRFMPPNLRTEAHSAFRDTWQGRLTPSRYEKHVAAISDPDQADDERGNILFPKKSIQNLLASEKHRGLLSDLLTSLAVPVLSSPLYIGRADNLKIRLRDHAVALGKWNSLVQRDPAHRERLREVLFSGVVNPDLPDCFATRAVASGFGPENLTVYVLDISDAFDITQDSAVELSEVFEWFLNTWNRPLLGRA